MKKRIDLTYCLILLLGILFLSVFDSCRKEDFFEDPSVQLAFSADTLSFDTIFTTVGSSTQWLRVYNPYDKKVNISQVSLAGGAASEFRINIDGENSWDVRDVVVYPHDSIFIFVEVTVDPKVERTPVLIHDSIIFHVNGNIQDVDLIAYGQDVIRITDKEIQTTVWDSIKPYLITGTVWVDTNQVLTLEEGARVYFNRRAKLVVAGTLEAFGGYANPVEFATSRTDKVYADVPGQWEGIHFLDISRNNRLEHVIIRNAVTGIKIESYQEDLMPDLFIQNSLVLHQSFAALKGAHANLRVVNSVFANCGRYLVFIENGGDYRVSHSTLANYWNFDFRITPSLYFSDDYEKDNQKYVSGGILFIMENSILHGPGNDELQYELENLGQSFLFDHCLIKTTEDVDGNSRFENVWVNVLPGFKNTAQYNFELDTLSKAKDVGDIEIGLLYPLDLIGNDRTGDTGPDLGAYERIEK